MLPRYCGCAFRYAAMLMLLHYTVLSFSRRLRFSLCFMFFFFCRYAMRQFFADAAALILRCCLCYASRYAAHAATFAATPATFRRHIAAIAAATPFSLLTPYAMICRLHAMMIFFFTLRLSLLIIAALC